MRIFRYRVLESIKTKKQKNFTIYQVILNKYFIEIRWYWFFSWNWFPLTMSKFLLTMSKFRMEIQGEIDLSITNDRLNEASFKRKLDPPSKNIIRNENSLELVFKNISTFDAQNSVTGSLLWEIEQYRLHRQHHQYHLMIIFFFQSPKNFFAKFFSQTSKKKKQRQKR